MIHIIGRSNLIGSSFYDKDGVYWTVDKMTDDTDEYLILLKSKNGDSELITLKKEIDHHICKYELGLLGPRTTASRLYRLRTYIPIEDIKYIQSFINKLACILEDAKGL